MAHIYLCIKDSEKGLKKDQIYSVKKNHQLFELTGHFLIDGKLKRIANKFFTLEEVQHNLKVFK